MGNSLPDGTDICELGGIPINRVAYRVIRPGEHWEPNKKIACLMFDVQPPIRSPQEVARHEIRVEDLRGMRVGRMKVIGYWGRKGNPKKTGQDQHVWLCKCPCGMFVTRAGSTIKKARDPDDKCEYCRQLEFIQRRFFKNTYGYWPEERRAQA